MSKRQVTDQTEIYNLLLDDPAMTEAVYKDSKGVYVLGGDGNRNYITEVTLESDATKQIIKLQRPITTTGSYNDIMFYNQDRSVDGIIPMEPSMMESVFHDEYKVYWWAWVPEKDGALELIKKAEEQNW